MTSTFHGLETARRGMFTQQVALQTTGNNISNANTPGYSRQRVNFSQTEAYPAAARNRPQIPGQMGTGVEAGSVQRVREGFLDTQFRGENNKLGFWNSRSEALEKMEDIMNEPSDNGLAKTMDRFWQSLQDLAVNPEDSGARSVVRQRGLAVAETFNYLSNSLSSIQEDMKSQADLVSKEVNSYLTQIANINQQIKEIEPHGYLPNNLYDERDNLVDQLSTLVNIKVTKEANGGLALPMAEGSYSIELLNVSGNSFATPVKLIDSATNPQTINAVSINYDTTSKMAESITVSGSAPLSITDFSGGKLKGLLEAYGYEDGINGSVKGIYPDMLNNLDEMALNFANKFNEVHKAGTGLDGNTNYSFFDLTGTSGAAKSIKLHTDTNNLDHIAAAKSSFNGDGSNALALADVKNTDLAFTGGTATLQSFYEGAIGKMAIDAQQAVRLTDNSAVLSDAVEQRRTSVSGVSLDEEMTNMIQYQHAYNASARNITVVDEMLDKIINGMGVGGR